MLQLWRKQGVKTIAEGELYDVECQRRANSQKRAKDAGGYPSLVLSIFSFFFFFSFSFVLFVRFFHLSHTHYNTLMGAPRITTSQGRGWGRHGGRGTLRGRERRTRWPGWTRSRPGPASPASRWTSRASPASSCSPLASVRCALP